MLQPDDSCSASEPTPISAFELQQFNDLGCAIRVGWGTVFTGAPNPTYGTRQMCHEGGLGDQFLPVPPTHPHGILLQFVKSWSSHNLRMLPRRPPFAIIRSSAQPTPSHLSKSCPPAFSSIFKRKLKLHDKIN